MVSKVKKDVIISLYSDFLSGYTLYIILPKVVINILRHSRRFFRCAYKALLPAAP
ncbi:hypothetical protein ZM36_001460 [Salmonella enterica subsp. diarizonae]|nr:hypothetical protein [Salmonella enterica subsp. diarizonae]EDT1276991.1 hypothetical protein [Salmonella enterica]EDT3091139.1 hypothetical protein [Salmonella enterica subsp. diarizonae]EDY3378131.1 hypothetical protein [Salmonella enterica]HAE6903743.1 hypothetical protein [Salmonella enterica subsp. diarizonae serovar 50:z:z52]